ncbi:endoplasmic oxidoreductin-1 [Friedmanniomyces endolithicus]|uniref:Endoplasmic oxidoreductin-1 n=1 Tax=Friedmanniomyces endolithicus TaxID=329885 RepID=A0AAN6J6X2_9PEZI|nr:endoplasmic oxidoreductin-1 [Friedmanniomyces endolithicus]KAK0319092.1 endoplasmic oxidoreductin-1 [Friedmanniomyces endolithicus]KAK0985349.1 endoplasmic oxidoreductin-1 [Friedmanniomyces endolithicus]
MRRSAAQAFYLAVFALLTGGCTVQAASPASTHTSPDVCALEPEAKVSDACASYADLDTLNNRLYPYIRNLANNTDFFSYYRLNLYDKECPFWSDENGLCGNIACAVTTLENETQIPQIWRAEKLSALEGPKAQHPGRQQQRERQRPLLDQLGTGVGESCVVEYDDECDDRDYCVPEDETASGKGDYVSLAENPERFTGYAGEGAHQVWEAIYRENCFSRPSTGENSASMPGLSAQFPTLSENQAHAAMDFKHVMKAAIKSGVAEQALDTEEECLEKRVFYRVISGMHASISTHLCHDYLNQTTGQWGPNLQCYKERLHDHPERLSNLYFNYALVLRAVGKLRDYVQDYTFCTGDPEQDQLTKDMIKKLAGAIPAGPQIFDESVMFTDQTADGISLKEDFRNRFRNVSRIMDCVGCDKCRLWGKIQTNGFGTALKVLFEFGNGHVGDQKPLLRRTELVALVNTLDKISAAMKALETFRDMIVAERDGTERVEQAKLPQASPAEMAASLDDFDDFADGEADQGAGNDEQSLTDVFREEFGLIFRAWVYVLKSWVGAPKKLGTIALLELSRLWDYWLGKPMRPRSWEFKGPDFREL